VCVCVCVCVCVLKIRYYLYLTKHTIPAPHTAHHSTNVSMTTQTGDCMHVQGFSRYDAMIRLTRPIHYKDFGPCGHVVFTGLPLQEPLTLIGAATLKLYVASSDTDADVFVYLQDYSPSSGKAR
jgi:predicted acyl esterase